MVAPHFPPGYKLPVAVLDLFLELVEANEAKNGGVCVSCDGDGSNPVDGHTCRTCSGSGKPTKRRAS